MDPVDGHLLGPGRQRPGPGDGAAGRLLSARGAAGLLGRGPRRPPGPVHRPGAGVGGLRRRAVRRAGRLPVLRVLRGHAGAGLLPHRLLRRAQAPARRFEVRPVLAGRRTGHARGRGGPGRLRPRRPDQLPPGVPGGAAAPLPGPGALDLRLLLHRLRDQGSHGPGPHLAAGHRRAGHGRHLGAADRRARQDRHLRDDHPGPAAVPAGLPVGGPRHRGPGRGKVSN